MEVLISETGVWKARASLSHALSHSDPQSRSFSHPSEQTAATEQRNNVFAPSRSQFRSQE